MVRGCTRQFHWKCAGEAADAVRARDQTKHCTCQTLPRTMSSGGLQTRNGRDVQRANRLENISMFYALQPQLGCSPTDCLNCLFVLSQAVPVANVEDIESQAWSYSVLQVPIKLLIHDTPQVHQSCPSSLCNCLTSCATRLLKDFFATLVSVFGSRGTNTSSVAANRHR